jgi:hypothetical protein
MTEESGAGRPLEPCTLAQEQFAFIADLYENGASDVEIKAYIRKERGSFSNDLWDRWLIQEDKFSETIKAGRLNSQAWWERNGRISLRDKDFNHNLWYKNMLNRFKQDWREAQDMNVGGQHGENPLVTKVVREIVDPANKDS